MSTAVLATTINPMGREKKPPAGDDAKKNDRHKPSKMVRLPIRLAELLQELADEDFNDVTEQNKIAVREYLQRRGKLPKSSPGQ